MKQFWKIVGIAAVVAILGAAAVGAVAYAQDGDDSGAAFDFAARFKEALAAALGIGVDEYDAAVEQAQDQVVDEALAEGWLTEDQAESLRARMDRMLGDGMPFLGRGFGRGLIGRTDSLLSIAAGELDMTLADLVAELETGKSISDVAAENGVDTQAIVDAYLAHVQEKLDQAVAEGRITQEQADSRLQQAEEHIADQLDNTSLDSFHGGRHHGGPHLPSGDDEL